MKTKLLLLFCIGTLNSFAQTILLGLTANAGASGNGGTIFITDSLGNNYTELKELRSMALYNGSYYGPYGFHPSLSKLCLASNGKFYGTANSNDVLLHAAIFEFDPVTNSLTTKYSFPSAGYGPTALVEANNGKLYGMSKVGGLGYGTIFEFDPLTGIFVTKKSFGLGGVIGQTPSGALTLASNGKLYGMTSNGGGSSAGVFFEFDPNTNAYIKRYDFPASGVPYGSVVEAVNGKLYGIGKDLFEYDLNTNILTLVYYLSSMSSYDLINGADNKLYGFRYGGGDPNKIFQYDPVGGVYNDLYDMGPCGKKGLMQANNGKFYAEGPGGVFNKGALYEYDVINDSTTLKASFNNFAIGSGSSYPSNDLIEVPCVPSAIVSIVQNDTICSSLNAQFTIAASGTFIPYQWQVDPGTGWTAIINSTIYSGATDDTLNITGATISMSSYQYRCIVGGVCSGKDTSNVASLIVQAAPIAQITSPGPSPVYHCAGDSTVLHSNTNLNYTYQWTISINNNGTYSNVPIAGATDSIYTAFNDLDYNVVTTDITNGCKTMSNYLRLIVASMNSPADIFDKNFCNGQNLQFVGHNTGFPSSGYSYQWQVNFGAGWLSFADTGHYIGSASDTLNILHPGLSMDGYQYRYFSTSVCSLSDTSNIAVLYVHDTTVTFITFNGLPNYCVGDTLILHTGPNAAGEYFNWYLNGNFISGSTNDTNLDVLSAGQYDYLYVNAANCSSKSTSINVTNCNVWPGDTEKNNIVDNNDLLPIGLYYGQTGVIRPSSGNVWQDWPSIDWGVLQMNGQDIKHADSNGDSIIDANDTLAINLNFNLTHSFPVSNNNYSERTAPNIYFITNGSSFNHGDWVDVEIWLGNSTTPISSLYGIAFNINYDASIVQPGTENITYPVSWLGTVGTDALKIAKVDALGNTAYGAITRINHFNANGYGKIADFKFQIKTMLTIPAIMHLSISNYVANDSAGIAKVFNPQTDSILINQTSGISKVAKASGITICPNPFSSQTIITFSEDHKNWTIKIIDVLGKEVKTLDFKGKKLIIEKGEMKEGIYFVQITNGNTNVVNRKIVVQ